jgi:YfiH family protein
VIRSRLLASCEHVAHCFTTKEGGVSKGPLAGLNLARRPGENLEDLEENWRRAAASCGLTPDDLVLLSQVHGARVLRVEEPHGFLDVAGDADALLTTRPGLLLAIRAADCVPILLAAPTGVGAVHSGWRGTAANVVGAATRALAEATGEDPACFVAAIGPHISSAAYEVGTEVVDGLEHAGLDPARFLSHGPTGNPHVDLGAAVEEQLRAAGVKTIEQLGVCTHTDPRLYSHRGEGPHTGRQAGLIALCDR